MPEHIDPATWDESVMHHALSQRDVSTVYLLLCEAGLSQTQISLLTGQKQSEVSEIFNGTRRVLAYAVLERICAGLGIPRGHMGLAYADARGNLTYPEGDTSTQDAAAWEEVDEDVKRRALLASGAIALFDRPILGEVLHLPRPPSNPTPLPTQLGVADVDAIEALTARMRSLARRWGGQAEVVGGIARRSEQLLSVSADEAVRQRLQSALAELHTVAGWCGFDERQTEPALWHFDRAMSLAGQAHDNHWIAFVLYGAGRITAEGGHPNEALKFYQLAQVATKTDDGNHPRALPLAGWLHTESALELAHLGNHLVREELAAAKDARAAGRDVDRADMDHIAAMTYMALRDVDKAEQFATSAVNQWAGSSNRRHAIFAEITLAAIYVQAGEPRGTALASRAIAGVTELRSVRARKRLELLATTLESRPSADMRDLARQARRVSATTAA